MFGLKDAIALLVIAFVSYQIGIFCIYLKDTKCCRNITIPSSAIMYSTFEKMIVVYVAVKFGLI